MFIKLHNAAAECAAMVGVAEDFTYHVRASAILYVRAAGVDRYADHDLNYSKGSMIYLVGGEHIQVLESVDEVMSLIK